MGANTVTGLSLSLKRKKSMSTAGETIVQFPLYFFIGKQKIRVNIFKTNTPSYSLHIFFFSGFRMSHSATEVQTFVAPGVLPEMCVVCKLRFKAFKFKFKCPYKNTKVASSLDVIYV